MYDIITVMKKGAINPLVIVKFDRGISCAYRNMHICTCTSACKWTLRIALKIKRCDQRWDTPLCTVLLDDVLYLLWNPEEDGLRSWQNVGSYIANEYRQMNMETFVGSCYFNLQQSLVSGILCIPVCLHSHIEAAEACWVLALHVL